MDQTSPGNAGSSSQNVPEGTSSNQDVGATRSHAHGLGSLSTNPPPNLNPVTESTNIPSIESQSEADIAVPSIHNVDKPYNSKSVVEPLIADTPPGYPGHTQNSSPSQRLPTRESTFQPSAKPGPATSHPFEGGNLQQVPPNPQRQQEGAGPSGLSQGEYDERAFPDWSAVRHGYDPRELFLFRGDDLNDKVRDGVSSQVSRLPFLALIP